MLGARVLGFANQPVAPERAGGGRDRLFSRACSHRTRANSFNLKEDRYKEEILHCEGGETPAEVAQRGGRCPIPGNIPGQVERGSEQPDPVEDVPAHGRGAGVDPPVLIPGVAPKHMQDLALGLVEPHEDHPRTHFSSLSRSLCMASWGALRDAPIARVLRRKHVGAMLCTHEFPL